MVAGGSIMPPTLRLYELSTEYLQALEALSELDDLPPEAIADTLAGLSGAWEDKALNVARFVRNLEAEATAIEEAKKRIDVYKRQAMVCCPWRLITAASSRSTLPMIMNGS